MGWNMSANTTLTADDGHQCSAYVAKGSSPARAGVVVVQEIFGVNSHIRSVVDDYAAQGFLAVAPALFDRVQPGLELGYQPADVTRGIAAATQIGLEPALRDVAAAISYAAQVLNGAKIAVVGYCLGGTLAWLASTRLNPAAAVAYYGGRIAQHAAETPRYAVMLHFGAKDRHIPPSEIAAIQQLHPDLPLFVYDAGHGFNCDQRPDYDPPSAALARQRTLEFLRKHLLDQQS
jgi:carboxymethylenebutenolidase